MKQIKLNKKINKLNAKDKNRLILIYDSLDTNIDFNSWTFILFHKKNILPILSFAFFINEALMLLLADNHKIISTIILFLAYCIPSLVIIGIDSFLERVPFFFYLKLKLKLLVI